MDKKLIRLTESDLHRIVKESVNRILKEGIINAQTFEYEGKTYTIDISYNNSCSPNSAFRCYIRKEDGEMCAMKDGNNAFSAQWGAIFEFVCRSKGIHRYSFETGYSDFIQNPPKEVEQGVSYIKKQLKIKN